MCKDLRTELTLFTGTAVWYKHPLFRAYHYTDGVQYLANEAGAYWLIDLIVGCQLEHATVKAEPFQVWDLVVNEDRSAWLIMTDGNSRTVHKETLDVTDFPLSEIRLYLTGNVLLLPSEY